MTTPVRLRLSRAKGFDLQAHSRAVNGLPAASVARPSKWGNRWRVELADGWHDAKGRPIYRVINGQDVRFVVRRGTKRECLRYAISQFRQSCRWKWVRDAIKEDLADKNVACWCPLDQPCHADLLLELANR